MRVPGLPPHHAGPGRFTDRCTQHKSLGWLFFSSFPCFRGSLYFFGGFNSPTRRKPGMFLILSGSRVGWGKAKNRGKQTNNMRLTKLGVSFFGATESSSVTVPLFGLLDSLLSWRERSKSRERERERENEYERNAYEQNENEQETSRKRMNTSRLNTSRKTTNMSRLKSSRERTNTSSKRTNTSKMNMSRKRTNASRMNTSRERTNTSRMNTRRERMNTSRERTNTSRMNTGRKKRIRAE